MLVRALDIVRLCRRGRHELRLVRRACFKFSCNAVAFFTKTPNDVANRRGFHIEPFGNMLKLYAIIPGRDETLFLRFV